MEGPNSEDDVVADADVDEAGRVDRKFRTRIKYAYPHRGGLMHTRDCTGGTGWILVNATRVLLLVLSATILHFGWGVDERYCSIADKASMRQILHLLIGS